MALKIFRQHLFVIFIAASPSWITGYFLAQIAKQTDALRGETDSW
jgi:hypothetical protein